MNVPRRETWLLGLGAIGLLSIATLMAVVISFNPPGPAQPAPGTANAMTTSGPGRLASALPPSRAAVSGPGFVSLEDGLAHLASFRATFTLTATSRTQARPEALNASLTTIKELSQAIDAQRIVYTYSDTLHPQTYQFSQQVRLGNSSFLVTGQADGSASCIAQPIRQPGDWQQLIPVPYSELGDLSDARYVGDETLPPPVRSTGTPVRARHYVIERSVLGDFTAGHAELWIAIDGGYVVKLHAEASGSGAFQSKPDFEGQLVARYELSQIDQPISIEPPAACIGDMPILAGAEEISIVSNLIAYKTRTSAPATVDFYNRQMPDRGWEPAQEPVIDQAVTTLIFQRGDQAASVLISPSTQGDVVQVMIIVTPLH